jgi:hypothetical protein
LRGWVPISPHSNYGSICHRLPTIHKRDRQTDRQIEHCEGAGTGEYKPDLQLAPCYSVAESTAMKMHSSMHFNGRAPGIFEIFEKFPKNVCLGHLSSLRGYGLIASLGVRLPYRHGKFHETFFFISPKYKTISRINVFPLESK